jgi:nitrite reductase/ring-hydroxylating ferredoxin subunit
MKAVEIEGREIVICNCGGTYRAIQRRCGHMNAPLELGTLDGPFVTCAMHCVQFDVTTGAALSGPVPADLGDVSPLPIVARYLQHVGAQMSHIRVESIRTYETNVEGGWVHIAL